MQMGLKIKTQFTTRSRYSHSLGRACFCWTLCWCPVCTYSRLLSETGVRRLYDTISNFSFLSSPGSKIQFLKITGRGRGLGRGWSVGWIKKVLDHDWSSHWEKKKKVNIDVFPPLSNLTWRFANVTSETPGISWAHLSLQVCLCRQIPSGYLQLLFVSEHVLLKDNRTVWG